MLAQLIIQQWPLSVWVKKRVAHRHSLNQKPEITKLCAKRYVVKLRQPDSLLLLQIVRNVMWRSSEGNWKCLLQQAIIGSDKQQTEHADMLEGCWSDRKSTPPQDSLLPKPNSDWGPNSLSSLCMVYWKGEKAAKENLKLVSWGFRKEAFPLLKVGQGAMQQVIQKICSDGCINRLH